MSLNSLAVSRVAREGTPRPTGLESVASDDAVGPKGEDVQNALSALVEYVPAETITLYLATLSSLSALVGVTADQVYWFFGALTPALFALIYAGKRRAAGLPRWPGVGKWPWWPMIAATIAFLAWGLSVPGGPTLVSQTVAGLLAVVVSTLLGVAGRFFGPEPV